MAKTTLKLNHYIGELNYQYAVFLSLNTPLQGVVDKLKEIFASSKGENYSENFKKIIVICYKDQKIDAKTLFNVLN